ncbi:MAG: PocR ligand-binding domain-containing protein [Clostridia bacterium]|nr:PocR ligand-binding domain-containing protein [Clostridia bacterium]
MTVNYDIPKINQCLQDFYNATGIHMDLLKEDFSFVGNHSFWDKKRYCKAVQSTPMGKQACLCSDAELLQKTQKSKKPEMHICHAGLMDIAIPILYNDHIIGYIIFGQIRTDTDFSLLKDYLLGLGLSEKDMRAYYAEIASFEKAVIQSISNIAELLVKHILLENMLKPNFDASIQRALNYIHENLGTELTVESISKNANISKSAMYRRFQSCFGCTVSEYISEKRIEKATELLAKSDLSVEEVSRVVGFSSGSYFSKIFKKKRGISPFQFKNNQKNT